MGQHGEVQHLHLSGLVWYNTTGADNSPVYFYAEGEDTFEYTYYAKNLEGFVSEIVTGSGTADTMSKSVGSIGWLRLTAHQE